MNESQVAQLDHILSQNKLLHDIIQKMVNVGLSNYYIGAGCIAQTVWNYQSGFELMHGISDVDIVYYDNADLSYEAEDAVIKRIKQVIEPCVVPVDIKNQARVHLWYKQHNGFDIAPYDSVESAINTWPTTATAIGVRMEREGLKTYAPFGLDDLFDMAVKPNKTLITEEIYMHKVKKWSKKWPLLTITQW